jgi:EAL domain-containing protein (putative c-di-GMP-specific phosphodiesterase class I)/CheY-like chemotaxis protein
VGGVLDNSVLVVDDDPNMLRLLERVLANSGFAVTAAPDSAIAEQLIRRERFDVILSDLNIAQGSGIDVLRCAHEHAPSVPVILLTGSPDLQSAIDSVRLGAFRYLLKPFVHEDLTRAVSDAAASHQRSIEARRLLAERDLAEDARLTLAANLIRARDELYMVYQPIVHWPSRSVRAYEALLRTRDTSFKHPGEILAAAERLQVLPSLGRVIRAQVAVDCASDASKMVFVNLHPHDLLDEDLYSPTAPLTQMAHRVVLELTERAPLVEIDEVRQRIGRLRALGYQIGIDDLGEGYASLNCLTALEPEVIKLDMSLIRGVCSSHACRGLIRSMVVYAQEAKVELVAEGVETAAERDALIALGCELFQGYLFARPGRDFPSVAW